MTWDKRTLLAYLEERSSAGCVMTTFLFFVFLVCTINHNFLTLLTSFLPFFLPSRSCTLTSLFSPSLLPLLYCLCSAPLCLTPSLFCFPFLWAFVLVFSTCLSNERNEGP